MLKVKYKIPMLYEYKKYDDSHLCCQSYNNVQPYAIRSAILSTIIQLDGIEKAQELFYKIKNSNIYISKSSVQDVNSFRTLLYTNRHYSGESVGVQTTGAREKINLDEIVFYIDNLIPNLEVYLKNIDYFGASDSFVYLDSIEEVNTMEYVYTKWNDEIDVETYTIKDWSSKTTFESIYLFSPKRKHNNMSYVGKLEKKVSL